MTDAAAASSAPAAPLARLAARIAALSGWRRLALAAGLGGTAVLALPPLHLLPLLIPALSGLVWQLGGVRRRWEAFGLGWAFGLGFFGGGLYWVGEAFLVDAATYGWMMPFAVGGLAAGLAIFTGLATLVVHILPVQGMPARALALALAWIAASWLRGHVLTGFPWNLLATAWDPWPAMQQSAAFWGAWGLSLATALAAAAPATLGEAGPRRRRAAGVLVSLVIVVGLGTAGGPRVASAPDPDAAVVPGVTLRIVQPSIPQELKWRSDLRLEHLKTYLRMTREPGLGRVSHVIWPETAIPLFLSQTENLRGALGSVARPGGALITGLPRLEHGPDGPALYNTLTAFDPGGETLARYDKAHLVPFGEYVPFEDWLPVEKLAAGRTGFSAGPGPRTLSLPGAPPVSPLICYEAIFPGAVTAREARPGWLLNVTNDAWFGRSAGPYQHLASARLRAVEEGLPLVRAANSGISVVVDPFGRTLARLELGQRDILDAPLPEALAPTPYARFGDSVFAVLAALLALALRPLSRRARD
jgi:apolipoprotein N-acyltransferase